MDTIKFAAPGKAEFSSAIRQKVNKYFSEKGISPKGNLPLTIKSLIMLGIYFTPLFIICTVTLPGWAIFPLAAIMAIGMSGIGMGVMHDAVHGSFSSSKLLNQFFGYTMYMIGGNVFNWRIQHNMLHHAYTNIDGLDEDIESRGVLRFSVQTPLKKIHRYQHIYAFPFYCLMTLSRMVNDFVKLVRYNRTGVTKRQGSTPRREMMLLIATKSLYLLTFLGAPLIFSSFSWWLVVLGFFTMHFVAGLFMSTVFLLAHVVEDANQPIPGSDHIIHNEWMVHELETTANFGKSRWFGWMIGGLNYQVEHHLFPNISHIHYSKLAPIVRQTAEEFGVRYNENSSFFTAIASHVRHLRQLGRA